MRSPTLTLRGPRGPRERRRHTRGPAAALVVATAATLAGAARPVAGQAAAGMEIGIDTRIFPRAPAFEGQTTAAVSPSLVLRPEWRFDSRDGTWRVTAEGFARIDAHDDRRSHMDVRELGVQWQGTRVGTFVGAGRVFWGVTEVRHLVDIVNQTDAVEDLDGEDRLGQPMLRVTLDAGPDSFDAMLLPFHRARTFPAADGRLRGPLPVSGHAVYEARGGRWHPDVAGRWYRPAGAFDLAVSYFRGSAREPRLVPDPSGGVLVPRYDLIDQVGLDAQWTGDATLLKLEAITRAGHGRRFLAATGGVEHTVYGAFGSAGDLGLLVEGMLDGRDAAAPPTPFDHDVFVGARWARNDVAGTAILGGAVVDWRTGEALLLVEADRRLGSDWTVALEARHFANTDAEAPAHALRRDGFVNLRLTRYF